MAVGDASQTTPVQITHVFVLFNTNCACVMIPVRSPIGVLINVNNVTKSSKLYKIMNF